MGLFLYLEYIVGWIMYLIYDFVYEYEKLGVIVICEFILCLVLFVV